MTPTIIIGIILLVIAVAVMFFLHFALDGALFPWEFEGEDGIVHDMYNMDDPYVQKKANEEENHNNYKNMVD